MERKRRRSKWLKGPTTDWLVPFRYNMWFQISFGLLVVGILCILFSCSTKNFFALEIGVLTIFLSVIILGATEFGRGTVEAYRRARKIIQREGKLGLRLQEKFGEKLYCYRAGARAAANEYDPSNALVPALAKKWTPF
ncbi:hypothetical protein [Pseudoduganella namucuonensis]|uniref:hypothetical protein n=1 Tax=Pseudoduganella namucuonensis TaxID=1035707 RepID=UPI0011602831|nr:hypothetical protein [Pseudoduganella namucuonensis]